MAIYNISDSGSDGIRNFCSDDFSSPDDMFLPDDFRLDDSDGEEDWTPRFIKRPRLDQGNDQTQGNSQIQGNDQIQGKDQLHLFSEEVDASRFKDYDTNDDGYIPEDHDQDHEDTVDTPAQPPSPSLILENERNLEEKKNKACEKRQKKLGQLADDWNTKLESVEAAFFESMQGGFPKAEAVEVEAPAVLCEDHEVKFQEVKLYFFHRHLKVKFQECDCKPLWKTLILLQFMPSSIRQPLCAVHFGFLQAIHDRKVFAQDSIMSWVKWMNFQNSKRAASGSGEELQPLEQVVLNECYLIYCTLLLSIEST
ncbi:uncharacterized protein EV154DRAFT_565745 [Mucor mucedo]|uniref:uncharacterized protein n=1 Tax=Mucor mucedo TaxID=29922 RepID=UPI00221FF092|nr:uncharacterized protein EV154DRAFT_565745 [Mucor mucedo]KAI7889098.1 hypothetical protein EV154DRAFT_565745 [Mucor mucedo]